MWFSHYYSDDVVILYIKTLLRSSSITVCRLVYGNVLQFGSISTEKKYIMLLRKSQKKQITTILENGEIEWIFKMPQLIIGAWSTKWLTASLKKYYQYMYQENG